MQDLKRIAAREGGWGFSMEDLQRSTGTCRGFFIACGHLCSLD